MDANKRYKCSLISTHYGECKQIEKAQEELNELIFELRKSLIDKKCLISEIADVYICLEHIKKIISISENEIDEEIDYKLERQLYRMENA